MYNLFMEVNPIPVSPPPIVSPIAPLSPLPPPLPPTPLPKKSHKLLWFLATLVFLSTVGYFAYSYYQNQLMFSLPLPPSLSAVVPSNSRGTKVESPPVSTPSAIPADWKTYTNKAYGFEVKYPPTWFIKQSEGNQIELSNFDQNLSYVGETNNGIFTVSINDNDLKGLTAKEWLDKETESCKPGCAPTPPKLIKEFNISGLQGIETNYPLPGPFGNNGINYFIVNNNKLFSLRMGYGFFDTEEDESKIKTIFNQILSTFKFTNTTNSDYTCPANGWQDCMPILSESEKKACSQEAMAWYKANCPNFQGGAL